MKQLSTDDAGYAGKRKLARREHFLLEIGPIALIESRYPREKRRPARLSAGVHAACAPDAERATEEARNKMPLPRQGTRREVWSFQMNDERRRAAPDGPSPFGQDRPGCAAWRHLAQHRGSPQDLSSPQYN